MAVALNWVWPREYHPPLCRKCVMRTFETLYGLNRNRSWFEYFTPSSFRRRVLVHIQWIRDGHRFGPQGTSIW